MKKRILPIPLILFIPIVLLIVVSAAGVYRFSMSDEEILAKFPSQASQADPIMQSVFGIRTANPWTVKIPDSNAFTFIDDMERSPLMTGTFEDGPVHGVVAVDSRTLVEIDPTTYLSSLSVSNQGSGVFYYLAVFKYDEFRQRLVSKGTAFLGDRIRVDSIEANADQVTVKILERDERQAMSEEPKKIVTILFKLTKQDSLEQQ
ncbi:hypothetical protein NM22_01220 [Vibrio tubiashii]|nr:hypothetical protein NM22_01220 [Vibrio tubiashii]